MRMSKLSLWAWAHLATVPPRKPQTILEGSDLKSIFAKSSPFANQKKKAFSDNVLAGLWPAGSDTLVEPDLLLQRNKLFPMSPQLARYHPVPKISVCKLLGKYGLREDIPYCDAYHINFVSACSLLPRGPDICQYWREKQNYECSTNNANKYLLCKITNLQISWKKYD